MNPEVKHDIVTQGAGTLHPLVWLMTWIVGIPLEKWLALAGIIGLLTQASYVAWKWRRAVLADRALREPPITTDSGGL